jgi:MFS family permease
VTQDPTSATEQSQPIGPTPSSRSARRGRRAHSPLRFSLSQTFASMRYPNYRLWFAGQLASLIGTWMQSTAQGFLVYELTHSPAYLGVVAFAAGIPSWLFTLYGGVVSDRVPRRTVLMLTQTAMMILALILAGLAFTHLVQPWHIVVLAFLLGVANAFDAPARQSFVLEMVDREDLSNAIALNSTMFNSATVVGPAVAGITYAAIGPAWCFLINAISFVAVIAALARMKIAPQPKRARGPGALAELRRGLGYVRHEPTVRLLIGIAAFVSMVGMGYVALMPAWAVSVLGGNSATNGWMQSARGLGSLVSALMIASLGRFRWKGRLLTAGLITLPVVLILFSFVRSTPIALLLLVGAGWAFMALFNMLNALIQSTVPDDLRGRVLSIYSLSFFGLMPIGSLIAGEVASLVSEPFTVLASSALLILFAAWLWVRAPQIRALK